MSGEFLISSVPFLVYFLYGREGSVPFLLVVAMTGVKDVVIMFEVLRDAVLGVMYSGLLAVLLRLPFLLGMADLAWLCFEPSGVLCFFSRGLVWAGYVCEGGCCCGWWRRLEGGTFCDEEV